MEFTEANARWCQRERWHHLLHVKHIAILRAGHCLWRHKSRSRTEYSLPTDCIIVLASYFNFTKKSNFVGNL